MIKKISIILVILASLYFLFKEKNFNDKTLYIGASLPKTGIMKSWGDSVLVGVSSYLNYVNENTILKDKKIKFISYDDKYEPQLTKENIKKLLNNHNIFSFFGFVGTPTIKEIFPILNTEKTPFFAPFSGAGFLRNNTNVNIINFRSSYDEEINKILDYLHRKNIKKIAVFYQNDDYGEEGYTSILKSLYKYNIKLVAQASYKRNTLAISHALNEIKTAKPEAIIMIGAYKTNSLFIKNMKENSSFKNILFCNISFSDSITIIKNLKKLNVDTNNLIFSEVVPLYSDTSLSVVREYQKLMKKYYPNKRLDFISLEAFLSIKTFVNAILNIKGNLTQKKLIKALKNPSKDLLSGLNINFKNSQLLNKTYLFKYENQNFIEIK